MSMTLLGYNEVVRRCAEIDAFLGAGVVGGVEARVTRPLSWVPGPETLPAFS